MKTLLVASLLLGSMTAFADHHDEWKNMSFADKKAKMSEKLDKKLKTVQENKSCVDAAQDDAALTACWDKMKEEKKEMHEKWKDKKGMKGKKGKKK